MIATVVLLASVAASATYDVTLLDVAPPRLAVSADLPIGGRTLAMDKTRPADLPQLAEGGWPTLVSKLQVTDGEGRAVEVTSAGAEGWQLAEPRSGRLTVKYEVAYAPLAAKGWPAPRESGLTDASHIVLVGRSIFVKTPEMGPSRVNFALPRGWKPVTPWEEQPGSAGSFAVADAGDLLENVVVFAREEPDVVVAGGFRLLVTRMGYWQRAGKEVRRVLGGVVPRLVQLVGAGDRERYLVVLLPTPDGGAESYRHSFALTVEKPPSRANSAAWGNLIAHEIFHLWNGWRLRGADYGSSQWFQEGFTEYAANVSMTAAHLVTQAGFLDKLSTHVANYRKLETSLEGSGSHKGPPLYSAGALVAFTWDVQLRAATGGKRNLWDFMRALWERTGRGQRPYTWQDMRGTLESMARVDWDGYHRASIEGRDPLPLDAAFRLAGLRLMENADGSPRVELDPAVSPAPNLLLQALLEGR